MKVPKIYWGEAILTAAYLINRMPSRVLEYQSPMSNLSTLFPNFQGFGSLPSKIFGCVCHVNIHSHLQGKFDPRAIKCLFLGHSSTPKGYKCYPPTKRKDVTMDVTFMENQVYFGDTYLYEESKLGEDRWWESNQPLPIPSVVYCPMPSATTDLGRNIGTGPGLGSISGTGTSTHSGSITSTHPGTGPSSNSGTPGSTFGTSSNSGPNESLSHDSHSQNPSIEFIEPTQISSTSKSLKIKNERPKTPISNVY